MADAFHRPAPKHQLRRALLAVAGHLPGPTLPPHRRNRILLIRPDHLGDVLLTGPVFRALKQAIPQAEVDAYIYKEALPMLEGHPDIDRLIGYDRSWKREGAIFRIGKELGLLYEFR